MPDLFAAFNDLPTKEAVTAFYRHDAKCSKVMTPGDSLVVAATLAECENRRGRVKCINHLGDEVMKVFGV